ncbi:MAG: PEP-CTERM sorting domain-containing protein [Pirellulales bacterium]|nr:PEP-CTERM sorting domain-containing protein [Pirellulales bacterium]
MRTRFLFTSLAALAAMLWIPVAANAYDLSTFGDETHGDAFQGRLARYTTFLGTAYGTTFVTDQSQGLYDYLSYPRSTRPTYRLNDGVFTTETDTYAYADDRYAIHFSGESGYPYDFYGYKFKLGATVDSLVLTQMALGDGGVFTSTPNIEVRDAAGNWNTADVSWNTPYDNTLGQTTVYTISFDQPSEVWGVRVIGDALDDAGSPDQNGFVAVAELQVNGTLTKMNPIDLTNNLALNQTPIWTTTGSGWTTQYGHPERLTDGNCVVSSDGWQYETTWNNSGYVSPEEEFAGVLFDDPQSNVAAVGAVMMMYADGGYITADTLRIEYLEEGGDWTDPNDWHSVSNLDLGTYDDNYTALQAVGGRYAHSELFTFDPIAGPIDGLRMIGTTAYSDDPTKADPDGFLGMLEFEAFAAVPEPGTVVLLFGALGTVLLILRRKK